MREIEVKARLQNEATFLASAKEHGIAFGKAVSQVDTIFLSKTAYGDPNWNVFRIRIESGKAILTMKYNASTRTRDNIENETVIADTATVTKMLLRLGYKPAVMVNKTRRIGHYQNLEVCLDKVEDLGTFVEIEELVDKTANVDVVQAKLWILAKKLGLKDSDRVYQGYDTLMLNQKRQKQSDSYSDTITP